MQTVSKYSKMLLALLNRKLGLCPKCMASSIAGSAASWLVVPLCYAAWPNGAGLALAIAVAFTLLAVTHVVVHMFRVGGALRGLTIRSTDGTPLVKPLESRREFTLAVARSGLAFAAASFASLSLVPNRAEGAPAPSCTYCLGEGCRRGQGSVGIECVLNGLTFSSKFCVRIRGGCPDVVICSKSACTVQAELISDLGCTDGSAVVKGWSCV